jgi:hypothetical protein
MCHIDLLTLITRESHVQFETLLVNEIFQFIFVEIIFESISAAIVENGLANRFSERFVMMPFLYESTERRQTSAWTYKVNSSIVLVHVEQRIHRHEPIIIIGV